MHYREFHLNQVFSGFSTRKAIRELNRKGVKVGPMTMNLAMGLPKIPHLDESVRVRIIEPRELEFGGKVSYKNLIHRAGAHDLKLCPLWLPLLFALSYDLLEEEVIVVATETVDYLHRSHLCQVSNRWGSCNFEAISVPPEFSPDDHFAFLV